MIRNKNKFEVPGSRKLKKSFYFGKSQEIQPLLFIYIHTLNTYKK